MPLLHHTLIPAGSSTLHNKLMYRTTPHLQVREGTPPDHPTATPITTYKAKFSTDHCRSAGVYKTIYGAINATAEPPSRRGCHCPPDHCRKYAMTRRGPRWWWWSRTMTWTSSASPTLRSRTGRPPPRAACSGWSRAL